VIEHRSADGDASRFPAEHERSHLLGREQSPRAP
jgi:hypothetical protein